MEDAVVLSAEYSAKSGSPEITLFPSGVKTKTPRTVVGRQLAERSEIIDA